MKITCQACQAKYTIADEKVVGKTVKIRCKKCGATIVVNGGDAASDGAQAPGAPESVNAHGEEPWTVNVDDGDQRTMTEAEVVAAYRSGTVNDDTFCWKDGMPDWLPLVEISALYAACKDPAAAVHVDVHAASPSHGAPNGGTRVSASAPPVPARPKTLPPSAPKEGNGASVAARRPGGRGPVNDLFGAAANAGGEDEVMTSVPPERGAGRDGALLFGSTAPSAKPATGSPPMVATTEASGLIDIRQLSAQRAAPQQEEKKSRVDDIMNLGAGAFGPTMAAPVLAAPSLDHISTPPPPSMIPGGDSKVKALRYAALGALGTCLLVGTVALVLLVLRDKGGDDRVRSSTTEVATAASSGAPGSEAKGAPSAAAPASAAPEHAAPSEPAPSVSAAAGEKETAPAKEEHAAAKEHEREAPVGAVRAPPREAPAAAAAAEFNMGEARARLGSIAGGVQSCKRGETTGSGRVEIVFSPSGGAQSVSLLPGSPFDGTLTAKCVEARFRGAHVPAFSGGPFTVTKSFSIN